MKYLLTALVLAIFGFHPPCYSKSSMEKFDRHDESLSLVYIGLGSESLKLQKFSSALDDFQKASALLGKPEDHPPELDVLILFGKVIACDTLGLKNDCLRCLNDLKSIINSENEIESSELSYDYNDFSLEDYQEAIEITFDLCHLALLACSEDVKEELFLVINKMFEDVQEQLYTGQNLDFQYAPRPQGLGIIWAGPRSPPKCGFKRPGPEGPGFLGPDKLRETEGRVELCKAKWIKKIEKIARRVYKVFKKVKEIWEFVKEVDEAFNSKNNERGEC